MSDLAHRAPGPAPASRAVLAQTGMELRLLLRSSESLVVTLGIPLGILVFFSAVDVLPTGDQRPVEFLVPGVLAISVMSTAFVAIAIQTAFERKYGVLKRLGATPLSRQAFLVSKALAVLVVLLVQTALVVLIARFGLGWEAGAAAQTDPARTVGPQLWLVVAGMLLGAFAFTALGLAMAGALRAEATLALSNAVFLLLLLVSGVAVDLDELPAALANAALFTPSGALTALLRDGLYPGDVALWPLSLLVLLVWGVGATVLAARTFRWEP
ncbi:MAG: ABC transporter permease [Actinomycetes bacterium]